MTEPPLATRLLTLRTQLGLTVQDFADLFGVSTPTAYRWEAADPATLTVDGPTKNILIGLENALAKPRTRARVVRYLKEKTQLGGLSFLLRDCILDAIEKEEKP